MAGTNPGPVRGTLKFDSTVTGDEADDKYRLAMHILAKMDVVKNTQQDTDDKDWVNTVDSYKNYVADWKNNGIIDGNDLSSLCSTGDYTNSDVVNKPWLPTIASNQTTISATQDTKITLTFTNDVTGGEANDFDIIDNSGNEVDDAIKGFAIDSNKVILTLKNDVDWSTSTDTYKVKHTMNKGVSGAPALSFANGDPIYDFEASDFTLTDALAPTVAISKAFNGTPNTDAKINTKDNLQILFTFSRSIDSFDIVDITFNSDVFDTATLTLNNDKDVATLSDIPALTDGTEYTFSVAADAFQSVSGVNNTASNDLKFTFDTTAPTIASGEVNADGDELILTMSENVVVTGDATARFTIGTQNPSSVTPLNGNKLTLALGTAITTGERPTIAYDNTGDGGVVKDEAGNAMATRTAAAIDVANWTNNSTQTVVYEFKLGTSTDNIIKYDGSNGKLTLVKKGKDVSGVTSNQTLKFKLAYTGGSNDSFANFGNLAKLLGGITDHTATQTTAATDFDLNDLGAESNGWLDSEEITYIKNFGGASINFGSGPLGNNDMIPTEAVTLPIGIFEIKNSETADANVPTRWLPSKTDLDALKTEGHITVELSDDAGGDYEITKTSGATDFAIIFTNISA